MEDNMCAVVDSTRNIKSFNCSIPMPYACEIQRNTECFKENNAQDYSGKLSMSAKGRQCNTWNETQYSRRHNYCRYTPGREQPWCFVDHGSSTTWELCYVGEPQKFCEKGSVSIGTCNVGQCPVGSICHPVSHECICPHGYEGLHCGRLCANKRWGYKCSRECPCGGDAGNCDPVTGTARCNVTSCLVDQSNTCTQANCGMLCLEYLGCQCDVVGECICP
ncbi:cell death abnormality protein 1-like, partial [Anneissia japonica]|uniref:cell death abnormality protein 1-like n=1 Tax=Anneissia japonica TaxID=1529436 RepID=UPI0014256AA5